ncbi:hypothetical protein H206_00681 [Candidatus Electrothrix aarhusensis]|uniref:Uncharacterized protein n=1 Tax=Candidatus Electrothrix aarhusensis TaxID=1859131 RepID=A0A3S3RQW5_9BACT|nr:hypothetical protein H206_00681 [Candidatus Electrothrix aarhusensis]
MTTCAVANNNCVSFSKRIESSIEILKNAGTLSFLTVRAVFTTLTMSVLGLYFLSGARQIFEKCGDSCPSVDCIDIEKVRSVRDRLITMSDAISQLAVVDFFTGKLVRKMLTDWDDLVEDMTIATDAEFRELISQVAGKIA